MKDNHLMNRTFISILWLMILLAMSPAASTAAVISAQSCSNHHVQDAIDAAQNTDTVMVPAGNCAWSARVTIPESKGIVLRGAGMNSTIITDRLPSHGFAEAPLSISLSAVIFTRITGLTFTGTVSAPYGYIFIQGTGGAVSFRVDRCRFDDIRGRGIRTRGNIFGLIDNNHFDAPYDLTVQGVAIIADGDASWERPLTLGTQKAVYVEDNVFHFQYRNDGALDAYHGARYVFRHNRVHGTTLGHHGFDSGGYRSTHSWEIYNNTFDFSGSSEAHLWTVMAARGGTGVYFSNTATGNWDRGILLSNYRSCSCNKCPDGENFVFSVNTCSPYTPCASPFSANTGGWGRCNETRKKLCSKDTTWACDPEKGDADCPAGSTCTVMFCSNYKDRKCSSAADCDGAACDVYLDGHADSTGQPCRDQVGVTSGQTVSPIYQWNNTLNGAPMTIALNPGFTCSAPAMSDHVKGGRNFFDHIAKPGYTPYPYPHPLRSGDDTAPPAAPSGLTVN